MHQHPSTGEGEIDPHPRAKTELVRRAISKERESERRKDSNMQTQRERKRERSRRRTHSSDREPRNRQTHSPLIVANPEIVAPFVKPEIVPPNRRSACSRSILSPIRLLFLISDFLVVVVVAWVVLVLLFSDFGLIFDLMIFFFVGY